MSLEVRSERGERLIFDWNEVRRHGATIEPGFQLVDETLRDGIQAPNVRNPESHEKIEMLHCMEALGIEVANIGLPGAGGQAVEDVTHLAREIGDGRMKIQPNCAARTHPADVQAILDIVQKTGVPIEICAFIGSSPVRRLVESWNIARMVRLVTDAVNLGVKAGLPVSFVTEDTIRTDPGTLRPLMRAAIEHGATRLVLTDTVGHATPDGLSNLLTFVSALIYDVGADVKIDWHGHNDRGLSLTLCLSALEHGVDRVHATALGIGERVGNAPIDLLLLNLKLLGVLERDLTCLKTYVEKTDAYCGVPIADSYPAFGTNAFRTATGVHAAAIAKALHRGRPDLADRVYSSVPASEIGHQQTFEVGFYSGHANAVGWLEQHALEPTGPRVEAVMQRAKQSHTILTEDEIRAAVAEADGPPR